ncbi:MAG: hypothetical protein M1819_003148 [Sarea resinae]|nr:MAG: hypothetical protein M1819_003148 [Sarea resinae]
MASSEEVTDEEKAEAVAAVAGAGIIENDSASRAAAGHDSLQFKDDEEKTTIFDDAPQDSQEPETPHDLESLATVSTATPPHSVFTKRQKQFIVFMVASGGFFSPLGSSIYFPALNTLAADLHVSNELMNLTLTSYMIFQGLAPTFFGDLADMAGRRPAYIIGFIIYIGACIGLALQNSYAALFILRCLQSSGSSGTIALGNGVVADIATSAERGTYYGYSSSGPMIGPAIGPVIGGLLSQYLGWRSIFWFLTILAVVYIIPYAIFQPETGRKVVGNGSIPPQGWNMSLLNYLQIRKRAREEGSIGTISQQQRQAQAELAKTRKIRFPNPLHTLRIIWEPDVAMLLAFNSVVYTAFYDITSSTPYLFQEIYGLDEVQIGLCYLPFGVGSFLAPLINGRLLDWNYRRLAKKAGIPIDRKRETDLKDFPIEKARIQIALPLAYAGVVVMFAYGWVLEAETSIAAPLVFQFLIGVTFTGSFNCMSVMLVDLYPMSPATATAANNLVRCLLGAAGTACIIQMIKGMGRGPCFTFIAAVVLLSSASMWIILKWGHRWREARRVRVLKHEEEKRMARDGA